VSTLKAGSLEQRHETLLKPISRKGAKDAKEIKIYGKRPEAWGLKALQGLTLRALRALRALREIVFFRRYKRGRNAQAS